MNLEVNLAGLKLKNPFMPASGTFAYGTELIYHTEAVNIKEFGAIVTKGISIKERAGNPPERIAEVPCGLLNSIGLENVGIKRFINEKWPLLKKLDIPVIVNVFGEKEEEFEFLAEELDRACVHAIELNLSCPNVDKGGMEFGQNKKSAGRIVEIVKNKFKAGPVFVKLAPNFVNIIDIAKECEKKGADGLSLINTIMGMAIDVERREFVIPRGVAGLSGPCIHPIALYIVYRVYQEVKIPIIGIGGIYDYKSALEFLMAGARACQIGSMLFVEPGIINKIIKDTEDYMRRHKINDIKKIIGCMQIRKIREEKP
ncbi:MAG: dihydroorotate dehydrogenase [candidate division WOR-3 bacterium]